MFGRGGKPKVSDDLHDLKELADALNAVQAVIWFAPDGTIEKANANFCETMGYRETELIGKNHRMFIAEGAAGTAHYEALWSDLRKGIAFSSDVERVTAEGRVIRLAAVYLPMKDQTGKVAKVVKLASNISVRRDALVKLADGLSDLSQGDLTIRLPRSDDADFGPIFDGFNQTADSLGRMLDTINQLALTLAREAAEITGHAKDLASRGESQAATLEETAASLEELSSAVAGTAENAQAAFGGAQTASQNANDGTSVVSDAINAMQDIKNGSSEIGKIIEVIDSISFQTNLLALNAGIEAARAGDAGRGFAVVASEIRALAQRTAEAAKDISDLIVNSNASVAKGAELVDQTGEALSRIVGEITSVVGNIEDISSASREQADGITSVTQATSQMDIATQQNAVLAEQSAQSAEKLAESAAQLRDLVAQFSIGQKKSNAQRGAQEMRWAG